MKILILFSGHICSTKKSAEYLADKINKAGEESVVIDTANKPKIDFNDFDAVIFGSNMRMFRCNKRFKRYARKFNRSRSDAEAYVYLIGIDRDNAVKNTEKAKQYVNGAALAVFCGGELAAGFAHGFAAKVIEDMIKSTLDKGEKLPEIDYAALDGLASAVLGRE